MSPDGITRGGLGLPPLQLDGSQGLERAAAHADAGEKFEDLLATMLVKQMRQSLPEGFFGSGPGADSFGGWFDKVFGEAVGESLEIAGMVRTSLDAKQARLEGSLDNPEVKP